MISCVELYQERFQDLLVSDPEAIKPLELREFSQRSVRTGKVLFTQVYIENCIIEPVTTKSDLIQFITDALQRRVSHATASNLHSSRSHMIVTFHLQQIQEATGEKRTSFLHMVDLAGSENTDKSQVKGQQMKEAAAINKSLSQLSLVIHALTKHDTHIPYRDSQLTYLLRDSLGGNAKTLLLLHCIPTTNVPKPW
jgi:hypothetical protein